MNWRDHLDVHPAAELFPPMSEAELKELADDIELNGLQADIVLWSPTHDPKKLVLLDGRNRLDALAMLDKLEIDGKGRLAIKGTYGRLQYYSKGDPYAHAISLNIYRRHLTAEQKRDLIAKVLKADPTKSDRAIAKMTKTDHKTVASERAAKERRGEIPHVKTRTDTKGREQPAKKAAKVEPKIEPTADNDGGAYDPSSKDPDADSCEGWIALRRRGLLNRAEEAVDLARFDDLNGMPADEIMCKAAQAAAAAWTEVARTLTARSAKAAPAVAAADEQQHNRLPGRAAAVPASWVSFPPCNGARAPIPPWKQRASAKDVATAT